jgi:HlyD family secretion protein
VSYKGRYTGEDAQENLDTEKATNQDLSGDLQDQIRDLALVILAKSNSLKTPAVQQEWYSYESRQNELKSKITQAKTVYERNKIV